VSRLVSYFLSDVPLPTSFSIHDSPSSICIYVLSLHDALPIFNDYSIFICIKLFNDKNNETFNRFNWINYLYGRRSWSSDHINNISEEHTSELQSRFDLVCRLLLEKKKEEVTESEVQRLTRLVS